MAERPFAAATERNAAPILEVLRREFRNCSDVLEIGSGTGQHAITFAAALDHLDWHTSDLDENHAGIRSWISFAALPNVHPPISFDVRTAAVDERRFDGVYSCNTAHIMSGDAVVDMFDIVGRALVTGGAFCLYGPFRQGGRFSTDSNRQFDRSLRERGTGMGLRDLEALNELGGNNGLARTALYAMPSNNMLAVWRRRRQ